MAPSVFHGEDNDTIEKGRLDVDDLEAIRRCRRGDIEGLDALVERYQTGALRLAYLLTGDRALADDVAQDSFMLAYRRIHRFNPDLPFAPWFYRIVTNRARESMRARRRLREVTLDGAWTKDGIVGTGFPDNSGADATPAHFTDPLTHAVRSEQRATILQALNLLTQKQREAIILRYYLGLSDRECSTIADCREGAFRVRLHDGLKALRQVIRTLYPWLVPAEIALSDESWEVASHVAFE